MAFKANQVMTVPATGVGGLLVINDSDETVAQVKAAAYWNTTNLTGADRDRRAQVEGFVKENTEGAAGRGCMALIGGSDNQEVARAYLHTDGRVRFR